MKLSVSHLAPSVDNARLMELFSPFGRVKLTQIVPDENEVGGRRGLVLMESEDAAIDAQTALHGQPIDGNLLAISVVPDTAEPSLPPPHRYGNGRSGRSGIRSGVSEESE